MVLANPTHEHTQAKQHTHKHARTQTRTHTSTPRRSNTHAPCCNVSTCMSTLGFNRRCDHRFLRACLHLGSPGVVTTDFCTQVHACCAICCPLPCKCLHSTCSTAILPDTADNIKWMHNFQICIFMRSVSSRSAKQPGRRSPHCNHRWHNYN